MDILVAFDTVDAGFERLAQHHHLVRPPKGRDMTREEILEAIPNFDILCSVFDIPIDRAIMDAGKRLKLIANYAVGYNNIDIQYAKSKGITVTNTPNSVVAPTAELACALILACTRRVVDLHSAMHLERESIDRGRLNRLGIDLYGKTLGILGYGNIGAAVAARCQAFGMKVLYNKRNPLTPEQEQERGGIRYATKEQILREADVISIHTPLTPETQHYIGPREFEMMKEGAVLINTARGPVVDEKALIQHLKSGKLFAAGLDVFEFNDTPSPELYELPLVVMTPHVGTQTYDARCCMVQELCDNVLGFIAGNPNISRVV